MDKYPHAFLMANSPWDPLVLDNKFEEEFYKAASELPEVKERRDGTDPLVNNYGFLRTCQDYELLFHVQDEFIVANASTTVETTQDVFYDTSSSGVTYCNDVGMVIHDYVPMMYFETMVSKLSAAPNRVRKLFPNTEKLNPFFGWASTNKIKTMLDKTTQHCHGVIHYPFCKHFKLRHRVQMCHASMNGWLWIRSLMILLPWMTVFLDMAVAQ